MRFWTFASLGFAGILDLAVGALIVHLLSGYFAHPLEWWQYIIGALLGASPDIDLFYAFFKKQASGHHEYLTHRPALGIPLATAVGWILGGEFWAVASCIGVFWHYLHDTEGFLGLAEGGLAWFWPFSRKYWGVEKYRIVSRTPVEHEGGNGNDYDFFYEKYLSPTRRSVTEFVLTALCAGYVLTDVFGIELGVAAVLLFWTGIVALWILYDVLPKRN